MKYKVTIQLDELLKENKISQYSLIKKTNLSHNFISKLVKHKEVANLDKLATIINALNEDGCNVKPSDLIKFTPISDTTINVIAGQQLNDSFYFFFELDYQDLKYFDLIKLTLKQQGKQLLIKAEANDTQLYQFDDDTKKAISAQSFTLGQGVERLVQLPSSEKKVAAQAFSEVVINQAIKDKLITTEPTYTLSVSYFDLFGITFNHIEQKDNQVTFIKDKEDSLIPVYPDAYQATYPFMHPFSVGRVEKGEHFTKPKPRKLSSKDKDILAILAAAFNNHK